MLYYLLPQLRSLDTFFNVFHYITVRSGLGLITAFLVVVLFGPQSIRRLAELKVGQVVRDDGPSTHLKKTGTPTMGGVLIVAAILFAVVLWADLANVYILTVLIVTVGYGAVGFADDYMKIRRKDAKGLSGKYKIILETVIGLAAILFMTSMTGADTRLMMPFFKRVMPDLGMFYIVFALVVILASSNAVNLTDGLDGLAIMPVVIVAGTYAAFAYLVGRVDASQYLYIPYVRGAGELAIFCGAIIGAGFGFLWYNCHPAEVFMGDVGALSLGGAIGTVAVIAKHELVLVLVGGIFAAEAVSVILQVGYFKWTKGKRLFRMAPLHHHFEQIGWPEEKVIVRFWIVQVLLALAGLATLKLR
ncbi:MAG TPA: phospho-N-acetylmuramoyl-pentapeptide-transferase [bacterium]|nr:phospho-N-acetylmuramoyl-pentapeptide-transferase [bacterium]